MSDFEKMIGVIGAIGVIGGILSWWLSRLLNEKKETTEMHMDIKYLSKRIEDAEKDIEHLTVEIEYLKQDR